MDKVTTKEKFKAILLSNGIDDDKFIEIMNVSKEYVRQLYSGSSRKTPKYMSLIVALFENEMNEKEKSDKFLKYVHNLIKKDLGEAVKLIKSFDKS